MDNLLSQPHQADEGAQRAGDHKAALETVRKQVLSARKRSHYGSTMDFTTISGMTLLQRAGHERERHDDVMDRRNYLITNQILTIFMGLSVISMRTHRTAKYRSETVREKRHK